MLHSNPQRCELRESSPRFEHANSLLLPTESALTRNDYIFECHMRQGPLSHTEKKPLLVKFLLAGKGRAQTSVSSVYTKHVCWNLTTGWEHRVGRYICTGTRSSDDMGKIRAPQCSQNCSWVINQFLCGFWLQGLSWIQWQLVCMRQSCLW